ncbi:MAG: hypothetical protein IPN29_17005 [Saprospiraceae bacterium]|nr:hypothetical protein [Saprospiraceae bacterium]
MTVYKEFNFGGQKRPMGNFGPLIALILFMVLMYFVVKGLFAVLTIVGPILLLVAAILDYTVITDYAKFIFRLLKENPIFGLVAIFLTVVGYPVVFGYLFVKAWLRRNVKSHIKQMEDEKNRYEDYEVVKEEKEEDFLILPKVEKPVEAKKPEAGNEYDDLFRN